MCDKLRLASFIRLFLLISYIYFGSSFGVIHAITLDPQHLRHPSKSEGSAAAAKAEEDWLKSFYQRISIIQSGDRESIKDAHGESLGEKIRKSSQYYLELKESEALEIIHESLNLLAQNLPYLTMRSDAEEILSTKLMANAFPHEGSDLDAEISSDVRPFVHEKSFLLRLPLKMQSHLKSISVSMRKIERAALEVELRKAAGESEGRIDRIYIYGEEKQFPLEMTAPGRILMQVISGPWVEAYWLDIVGQGENQLEITKIWEHLIWKSLRKEVIRENFLAAKPIHLNSGDLKILMRENEGQPIETMKVSFGRVIERPEDAIVSEPKILRAKPISSASATASATSAAAPPKADPFWLQSFNADLTKQDTHEHSKIFKSPWFWVASVALATAIGVVAYSATQDNSVTAITP